MNQVIKIERRQWLKGSTALAMAVLTVPAAAQDGDVDTVKPTVSAQSTTATQSDDDTDTIVVTGIRSTIASAIDAKRAANVIQDGISADDLGNFPDLNLGEALQRIPGVQIDREAARREASISVRGLPGNFAKTTVMGQNIASPRLTGSNPFGVFDSAVFSGANVIKSFTPDIQSGGLAANVDLLIKPALARKDGQFIARVGGNYESLTEVMAPELFFSGAKHSADGRFGVFGAVSYSEQNFRRDSINPTRYDNVVEAMRSDDFATSGEADRREVYVGDFRQFVEASEGDRTSIAAGLEFQPSDGFSLRIDGLYAERNLDKATTDILQVRPVNSAGQVTPVGDPVFAGEFNFDNDDELEQVYVYPTIQFDDPQFVAGNRDRPFFAETFALYPQATWENDDWRVRAIGTISESSYTTVQNQFDARIQHRGPASATSGGNGITAFLNTGGGDIDDYVFDITIPAGSYQLDRGDWGISGSTVSAQTGRFFVPGVVDDDGNPIAQQNRFVVGGFARGIERELMSLEGDVERFVDFGPIASIKVGARYEDETGSRYDFNNGIIGARLDNLTNEVIGLNTGATEGDTFFGGTVDGVQLDNFLSVNRDRVTGLLAPIQYDDPRCIPNPETIFCQRLGGNDQPIGGSISNNFEVDRENFEAFAMASFDFSDMADIGVRGNFGVRYVDTTLSGLAIVPDADTGAPVEADERGEGEYTAWLPSANVIWNITDSLVFNAAYYETFEAFNLAEFSPAPTVIAIEPPGVNDDGDATAGRVSINATELDLEPRSSEAFDIGLAWYNRSGSIIGINYFTKDVSADIIRAERCPAGGAFGFDVFIGADGNTCFVDDGEAIENENRRFSLRQSLNGEPITVNGIEFQVTQDLGFLENSFLSGFGGTFNYSYVDFDGDAELLRVSKDSYNLIGYYETDLFSVRLAQNFRSDYALEGGGSFTGAPRQVKGRSQLDLSATVNPGDGWQLRFQAFNLTDAIREEFQAVEVLARRTDYDGRTYSFSVQKRF